MKRSIWTLIGFLLFMHGMVSLILSLISVKIVYLVWLDRISPLFGFVAKVMMVLTGILIVVLAATDWKKERALLDKE